MTRFYLNSDTAAGAVPNAKQSADTILDDVATSYATYANPARMSSAAGSNNSENDAAGTGQSTLHYTHYGTWVSDPLAAQTVSGTVTISLVMSQGNAKQNNFPRVKIYKWLANDTFGSDLLALTDSATELLADYPSAPVTYFSSVAITQTTFAAGDRIVIEIETSDTQSDTKSYTHGIRFDGADSGGYDSHVEFSATIILQSSPVQKSMAYAVQVASYQTIQKGLVYEVRKVVNVPIGLVYNIKQNYSIPKDLIYKILTIHSPTKDLAYEVVKASTIQKDLDYAVPSSHTVQADLDFMVSTIQPLQGDLDYLVSLSYSTQKGMEYVVPAAAGWVTIYQDLDYNVMLLPLGVYADLDYLVSMEYTEQQDLDYLVLSTDTVGKDMEYVVPGEATTIQKSMAYSVLVDDIIIYKKIGGGDWFTFQTLHYADCSFVDNGPFSYGVEYQYKARRIQVIDEGIPVYLPMSNEDSVIIYPKAEVQKDLAYRVFITPTIQKSLVYRVITIPATIEKSLAYETTPLAAPWIDSVQVLETIEVSWWS
jgi:hypothetical protein